MLAEEFVVVDGDSLLWMPVRPLVDIAKRFEQYDDTYTWRGWNKQQIKDFLNSLPSWSSLVIAVWETILEDDGSEYENLALGIVCSNMRPLRIFMGLVG